MKLLFYDFFSNPQLKVDLDGLPKVPEYSERPQDATVSRQPDSSPLF
ncbi:hypothetical protein GXM_08253 [Nostoc sphaeroides CCNUC1]|uniref:Uncharacterized protein n=1 Tax=Nostoc sphaeroides CCNUC1 TaxID=2653204 RepID=A0A5P8WG17_9NOSO|nr:hypothetical protein GXM_08253 [Nostoc sphaeroides CCNUC1]